MLKGIPKILSPELLKALCEMGHSDRLVIADGNFPAESVGKNARVIRMDGCGAEELLDAVLALFPLDHYVEKPVLLMEKVPGDKAETPIWESFRRIVEKHEGETRGANSAGPKGSARGEERIGHLERFRFYKEASEAYLIIASSERALYANVILQKGVVD